LAASTIQDLFREIPLAAAMPQGLAPLTVSGLCFDSRLAREGSLFFAFAGANADGRSFAAAALAAGALAVVSELPPLPGLDSQWIQVPHGRRALALASRAFHDNPTLARVPLFGVTGTNGKTTTAHILASILDAAGFHTGLFGTISYRLGHRAIASINTTPESLDLYSHIATLESEAPAPPAVAMEVSSHALALGRVWGFHFAAAIWTNLTRDHLDFHGGMDSYFAAKAELFQGQDAPPPAVAAVNLDDPYGAKVPVSAESRPWHFAIHADAPVKAVNITAGFSGVSFDLLSPLGNHRIHSPLLGDINVYNILGAAAATLGHGISIDAVQAGIANCSAVPGRFERVDAGQPFLVIVDYAHTDDAIRNVIRVARSLTTGRIITLFGCGGDRDRAKRPLMGAAAAAGDYIVLTTDNPRTEDPLAIMNDALVGIRRYDTPHTAEPDREKAIFHAIALAQPGDIVLLAGKGHEDYQIIGKTKYPFDDREVARRALAVLGHDSEVSQ
jgi:UDP-N-acetylmuramoyl-L-alanyl-D-glutamate--2,6-diaminopimelate ligase